MPRHDAGFHPTRMNACAPPLGASGGLQVRAAHPTSGMSGCCMRRGLRVGPKSKATHHERGCSLAGEPPAPTTPSPDALPNCAVDLIARCRCAAAGAACCAAPASEPLHETRRSRPPVEPRRHLGRQLPVHARAGAGDRRAADGVLPRGHLGHRPGGDPGAVAGDLGLPRQAGQDPADWRGQLGHSRRHVRARRRGAAGGLLGHLQRHHAIDGRADRRVVLRREADPAQGGRRAAGPGRRGGADRRRAGGLRRRPAARCPGLPDGDHLLRLRRVLHQALDQRCRWPGQRPLGLRRPGRRDAVPAADLPRQQPRHAPGAPGRAGHLAGAGRAGAAVHLVRLRHLLPPDCQRRPGEDHDGDLPHPAVRGVLGALLLDESLSWAHLRAAC